MSEKDILVGLKIGADATQAMTAVRSLGATLKDLSATALNSFALKFGGSLKNATLEASKLNKEMARLSNSMGIGSEKLKSDLYDIAKKSGESSEALLGGFNALSSSGLDSNQLKSSMEVIGQAMTATGASADQLGAALFSMSNSFGIDLKDMKAAQKIFESMYVSTKNGGGLNMSELSDFMTREAQSGAAAGLDVTQSIALVQQLSRYTDKKKARGQFEALTNLVSSGEIKGISLYDKDGSKKNFSSIMSEMQSRYKNMKTDAEKDNYINKTLGGNAAQWKKVFENLFEKDGLAAFEKMGETLNKSSGQLRKDADDAGRNLVTQLSRSGTILKESMQGFGSFMDKPLGSLLKGANDFFGKKDNKWMVDYARNIAIGGAISMVGLKMLGKSKGIGGLPGVLPTGGGLPTNLAGGVFQGKMLEKMSGVQSVFVVNMPSGFGGGGSPSQPLPAPSPVLPGMPPILPGALPLGGLTTAGLAAGALLTLGPMIALSIAATKNWGKSSDDVMKERYADPKGEKMAALIADGRKKREQEDKKREERERRQQQVDVNVRVDVEQEKGLKADCRTEVNSTSKHFGAALDEFYRKNGI